MPQLEHRDTTSYRGCQPNDSHQRERPSDTISSRVSGCDATLSYNDWIAELRFEPNFERLPMAAVHTGIGVDLDHIDQNYDHGKRQDREHRSLILNKTQRQPHAGECS